MIHKYRGYFPLPPAAEAPIIPPANNIASGTPTDSESLEALKKELEGKDFEQLVEYAKENSIDIGAVTTAPGALKKIYAHLEAKLQPEDQ